MTPRTGLRLMATLCVALAAICAGLAVIYHRKAEALRCYQDAAELGIAPVCEPR
jgi:hypothetical protein